MSFMVKNLIFFLKITHSKPWNRMNGPMKTFDFKNNVTYSLFSQVQMYYRKNFDDIIQYFLLSNHQIKSIILNEHALEISSWNQFHIIHRVCLNKFQRRVFSLNMCHGHADTIVDAKVAGK
ncbi:hypothetical protein Glove_421g77 [Diversispora epigaea]|uniref:Uncharacterized protein n=1 Tax=Diversispora epigaea TaxID=1348612 RepID=A0A397GZU4_9GLOM|nr:hypothetical protein Glove_421g77 [Diversispora epigaea]